MLILIDRGAGLKPFNVAQYQDKRSYYLLERSLVVCRNNLTLSEVQGQVCDCPASFCTRNRRVFPAVLSFAIMIQRHSAFLC